MARPQFQLTGAVVHVETPTAGPVLRTQPARVLRTLLLLLLLVPLLLALVLIRFSLSVAGTLAGDRSVSRHRSRFSDFISDTLAHLTAKKIGSAGETTVTVVRVRDSAGQVFPIRCEGHLISGSMTYGDHVTVRLRVVDGVLLLTEGVNHTTGEAIRLGR